MVLILALTFSIGILPGCGGSGDDSKDDGDGSGGSGTTYSVADLQGTWDYQVTIGSDSWTGSYTFDNQGNFIGWTGPTTVLSTSGKLTVSGSGDIQGVLHTQHINGLGNTETTDIVFDGTFVTKTKIVATGVGTWSASDGSGGTYNLTYGYMNK